MQINIITRIVAALAVVAVFSIAGSASADSFFKQVTHSDAVEMMGQKMPETNDTTMMWVGDGKAYSRAGSKETVLYDGKEDRIYVLNHELKQYSVISFGSGEGDGELDPEAAKQAEMMKAAQAMMGTPKVTVTKTDETKAVGDWQTTLYNVEMSMSMMKTTQEMWVTTDIEADYSTFQGVFGGLMAQMPGFGDMLEKMKQIEGIPVLSIVKASMMGQEMVSTTTLIEYAEKDAPAGIFDIPDDYKKVAMSMGGM